MELVGINYAFSISRKIDIYMLKILFKNPIFSYLQMTRLLIVYLHQTHGDVSQNLILFVRSRCRYLFFFFCSWEYFS